MKWEKVSKHSPAEDIEIVIAYKLGNHWRCQVTFGYMIKYMYDNPNVYWANLPREVNE